MKFPLCLTAIAAALAYLPGHAQCAEIVLEQTAVEALLMDNLFKDKGRLYLQKGVCNAFIETPKVTLKQGRVLIRLHLSSRLGVPSGKECLGMSLASWATVSAAPVAQGQQVRLNDIRIDEVEDPNLRSLLELGLTPALPQAVEFDVKKAVEDMLQGTAKRIQADVQRLNIESVKADNNQLSISFDFKLVGK